MNDTKWREVVACLRGIPGFYVEFRVRCVRDPLDEVPRRDRSFPWHLPPYKHIEWLDIDPVVRLVRGAVDKGKGEDFTDVLLTSLKAIPAPVSRENGYLRIWGYYRPGESPDTL
jgi:hypothetical protein